MTYRASPADGVAWITGASTGIGRATALELARRGWTVCASARTLDTLEKLAGDAAGLAGRIVAHPCDVTDEDAVMRCVEGIEAVHGPIALAFLNAGIAPYVRAGDLDVEAFRKAFAVNLFGPVHGLAALLPRMRTRGRGQIGVNGSIAGYAGLPRAAAYGATKAAVIHMCEALKYDTDLMGVTLQLVNPGFIDTPLTRQNDFPMPFLMKEEEAGRRVVEGFASGGFEITFPRRLAWILKAFNLLPYPAYFWLVSRGTGWAKRTDRGAD